MAALFRSLIAKASRLPPPVILAVLYGILILCGAALMMLPLSQRLPISWSDALFTSTSAVTVTGLAVFDTGTHLTLFGQLVLLVLIQMGGLGLMTFAVFILGALGLPVGITGNLYLRDDLSQNSMRQLSKLVMTIVKVVLFCEVAGALVLSLSFMPRFGFWPGLWEAMFHSVSAFNNAGFSTFPTGLMPFATDPVVNTVIPALFIVGGIGYVVLHDIVMQKSWRRWSLHTKIMLTGTAILIPWSVGMFALLEWNNPATLAPYDSTLAKLTISWFQGVTTRSAGFNTTDIAALNDSTTLMVISLMLIGGGPTSTAGGIKVTTFVVMVIATVAFFRQKTQLHLFGRAIGLEQVFKVMALTAITVMLTFAGLFLLLVSHDGDFLKILFEVASAVGTVGLSQGYTTELSDFGRAVISLIMFIGRVGPLTLGFFLASQVVPRVRYPEGKIFLG